jgi:hypothetical protein
MTTIYAPGRAGSFDWSRGGAAAPAMPAAGRAAPRPGLRAGGDGDEGSSLGEQATPIQVMRYNPQEEGDDAFTALPNVVCDSVDWRAGWHPPVARFHYLLDVRAGAFGLPTELEQLWPLGSQGPYVVQTDDRLVVVAWTPAGERRFLFDGHAQVPELDLSANHAAVAFTAVGVAARCFDLPIAGRLMRDADDPKNQSAGVLYMTALPTVFNPTDRKGKTQPNASPKDCDYTPPASADDGGEGNYDPARAFPVFLDQSLQRSPDPRQFWTLDGAMCYLLGVWNDQTYVANPDFRAIHQYIQVRYPLKGKDTYDPTDPATYQTAPIPVRHFDATNQAWPEAIAAQLEYAGFGFKWDLYPDEDGRPKNIFDVYRLDQNSEAKPKLLWLDRTGSWIDPTRNNVEGAHLARDLNSVVNVFVIESHPIRYECTFILAPGFTPDKSDATSAGVKRYFSANLANATAETKRKYRWYVADEAGDGHWSYIQKMWVTGTASSLDLSPVFPDDDDGNRTYVRRLRAPAHELLTLDEAKRPRRAILEYSIDCGFTEPRVFDPTLNNIGTWHQVSSGWKLLHDRIGIEVDVQNPDTWHIGEGKGLLHGIKAQADPSKAAPLFFLRLTTVIEDDLMLSAGALKRKSSPTRFARARYVDARDHFRKELIHLSSTFWEDIDPPPDGNPLFWPARDDTQKALDHAYQLRSINEVPPLAGSVTIPYLTNAYVIGDRIRGIAGRDITFQSNIAANQKEKPWFPFVVGVSWHMAGDRESTTLHLSDIRAQPQKP